MGDLEAQVWEGGATGDVILFIGGLIIAVNRELKKTRFAKI